MHRTVVETLLVAAVAAAASSSAAADDHASTTFGGVWPLDHRPEDLSDSGVTPFRSLPQSYIDKALKDDVDWRKKGVVTVAKGQTGGNCGTWARTSAGESSYALGGGGGTGISWPNGHAVNALRNFSEQQSLDCVPPGEGGSWFFYNGGFESLEDYPTNRSDHGKPGGAPCKLDKSKIIPNTGKFSNRTDPQHALDPKINKSEAIAAFIHYNGPCQGGIDASIFYHIKCDAPHVNCWAKPDVCMNSTHHINHAITIIGYGTDPVDGPYWIIKNSWDAGWQENGTVKLARNLNCAGLEGGCTFWMYGDEEKYWPPGTV